MPNVDLALLPEFVSRYPNALGQSALVDQVCTDTRILDARCGLFVALSGLRTDGHLHLPDAARRGARFALVKSGTPRPSPQNLTCIEVADPLAALQELAAAHRKANRAKVIGITGSFGKTMCKDLLHHLLSSTHRVLSSAESFNSQLGVALSLLQLEPTHDWALIECGISQPGEMRRLADMVCPDHALFTSLGSAHLDTLQTSEGILREKCQLFQAVPQENWCLLFAGARQALELAGISPRSNWFSGDRVADWPRLTRTGDRRRARYRLSWNEQALDLAANADLNPRFESVDLAIGAAHRIGIDPLKLAGRLGSYRPEPRRLEIWRTATGFTVINQPYCGDLLSLEQSLDWLRTLAAADSRRVLWFGGLKYKRLTRAQEGLVREFAARAQVDELSFLRGTAEERLQLASLNHRLRKGDLIMIQGSRNISQSAIATQLKTPLPPARLSIDLAAVDHNIRQFRNHLPPGTALMAMLKATAYGTDSVIMAKFLARGRVESIGVATIEEALALRRAGVAHQLFVLHAEKSHWELAVRENLQICISDVCELEGIVRFARKSTAPLKVHLHVNTGMCRLGCSPKRALALATRIQSLPSVTLEGVMTHLAGADAPELDEFSRGQIRAFERVVEQLKASGIHPRSLHVSNSAGALRYHHSSLNLIRLGLSLYGLHPHPQDAARLGLQLALRLTAKIAFIHRIKRGETVSYGRRYIATRRRERIGVLSIGYADGLHSGYSGRASVIIRGRAAPLVGAICMDFAMVDLTDIPEAHTGDDAILFGKSSEGDGQDLLALAKRLQVSPHELLACLGPRIQRIFTYDR